MKLLLPIFLTIIMMASVTVPLVVQLQGEDMYELKESNGDDSDNEFKVGKEKEVYIMNSFLSTLVPALRDKKTKEKQYYLHDRLFSENHSFLPEIPPDI
jgi:hypothetical protein